MAEPAACAARNCPRPAADEPVLWLPLDRPLLPFVADVAVRLCEQHLDQVIAGRQTAAYRTLLSDAS